VFFVACGKGVDELADTHHGDAIGFDGVDRVLERLFEAESVGHDQCRIPHGLAVAQRRLERVRVRTSGDDGGDLCEPVACDVAGDVGPHRRGRDDGRYLGRGAGSCGVGG